MHRLLATALLASALPTATLAQGTPTLWDLITPDRILRSVLQSGIMALRTQADIKYGDMSIDIAAGRVTLTDVQIWPLPEWDLDGTCEIRIDRLTLRTAALDELDRLRLKLQAAGTTVPDVCLPEEPRGALAMAGLGGLDIPRLTLDVDYDVRSSGAEVELFATIKDVASAALTADFEYIWVDGRYDMEEPDPVVFLDDATLRVENLGLWSVLQNMAPPEFTNPDNAALVIEGMLGGMLAEANRDTAPADMTGDPSALTETQRSFLDSVAASWPAFLRNPETIVIETAIDGDVYLDFELFEDDPRYVFDTLRPVVALAPASTARMLPVALLQQALGDASGMSIEDRRTVGLALVNGDGAPRNVPAGITLLADLAEAGDGTAAMALSDALATRDRDEAYRWALRAGAAGEPGATARLDRLEAEMGLAAAIALQQEVSGDASHDPAKLESIALIRDEAAMRMSGRGLARSYPIAAMWAMIGTAAGDAESADILADIDDRVRLAGAKARSAWAAHEAEASRLATEAWLGMDLPTRFRP